MLNHFRSLILLAAVAAAYCSCKTGKPAYRTTASGLEYRIIRDQPGGVKPRAGDQMLLHIRSYVRMPAGDSVLYDSRSMNAGRPVPYTVMPPSFNGDISAGLMMLTEGDSAEFRISVDSMIKATNQTYDWMRPGQSQWLAYTVVVAGATTTAASPPDQQEAAAKQSATDEQLIRDYLTKNNIRATRTPSGLYYKIDKKGTGPVPATGDSVSMNYTGMTLDGTKFDSNVDPQFNHVMPFWFTLGMGQVIKGWDEGIALMPKGSKGTLYIPSGLAYGARSPTPLIPAHSVLVFDVEVADIRRSR